ncbi:MAG: rhodanese-like domain-containing protein [Salibacteraceae bacterium]
MFNKVLQFLPKRCILPLFWSACLWVFVIGCHPKEYKALAPQAYKKALQSDSNCVLIDVRTRLEYREGHLKGAINIPYSGPGYGHKVDSLDTNLQVFVYCATAHRSPMVVRSLRRRGFTHVFDLKGGYTAWRKKQLPYTR